DPETGVLYVPSIASFTIVRSTNPYARGQTLTPPPTAGRTPLPNLGNLLHPLTVDDLPIIKPPYSRVTAIDMNKGEHVWMTPLGKGPLRHPLLKDLGLGPLGDYAYRTNALLTKTVLFVTVVRLDASGLPNPPAWSKWSDPDADRQLVYVFDKSSGRLLHTVS